MRRFLLLAITTLSLAFGLVGTASAAGRPADNPHNWGAWSPVASLALGGRSVQMRQCIYCRTVVMSEQPSLTDCDPGDEQP